MKRLWLAVISGLVLGFILMGMMLRGCQAGAELSTPTAQSLPAAVGPVSHLPKSKAVAATPAVEIRSTFGSPTSSLAPRARFNPGATGRRGANQQLTRAPVTPGRGFDVARALSLSRQSPRSRRSPTQPQSPSAARAQVDRSVFTLTQHASVSDLTVEALQTRILAQSELLAQLDHQQRQRASGARRDGLDPQTNPNNPGSGGGINGEQGSDSNGFFFADGSRAANAITTNANPGGVPNTTTTGGANVAPPPIVPNPISPDPGATTPPNILPPPTGPGSAGSGDTGASTGNPPPAGDTTGAGAGDTTPPPPPTEPAVIARWAPVTIDSICGFDSLRTNDLFLGFREPRDLQVVTSAPPLSLNIQGGSFHQDTLGSNLAPDAGALALDPCVAFDSFLTIGDLSNLLTPVSPDPNNWGGSLNAVWSFSPSPSNPFGAAATQDPVRFGDDRYYVRVGRFTATGNPDFIGGALVINAFDPTTFSFETNVVTVDYVPELWAIQGAGGPSLASVAFEAATAIGGIVTTARVTLQAPAPDGGVEVVLTSPSILLGVPDTVTIPAGETSVRFNVMTSAVQTPTIVTMYALLQGSSAIASVTLTPPPTNVLNSLSVAPAIVRGGMPATGTVSLTAPAPPGGTLVHLSSDDFSIANPPATVLVPEGQTQATFAIPTATTQQLQRIVIWSFVNQEIRTATLTVTVPSDLTGDGLVDGADLAQLLVSWNTADPLADINGDGLVNGVDLATLLVNFNETITGDVPFTGAVIARWIPVPIPDQCSELANHRSNDLYLGFENSPQGTVVSSMGDTQLFMTDGVVYQDPLGTNSPPADAIINAIPCLAFDSYLTIGGAAPSFTPGSIPDSSDWGSTLAAEWFTTNFDSIVIEHNPAKFGDARFYLKIARITATQGVRIDGRLTVNFVPEGGTTSLVSAVPVLQCPVCWVSFDLNEDGAVNSGDVAFVMALLGTDDSRADLDRDGLVTAADVSLIVTEISKSASKK